jgi:hypothetical protein
MSQTTATWVMQSSMFVYPTRLILKHRVIQVFCLLSLINVLQDFLVKIIEFKNVQGRIIVLEVP